MFVNIILQLHSNFLAMETTEIFKDLNCIYETDFYKEHFAHRFSDEKEAK